MVQLADRVAQGIAIVIKLRDDALVLLAARDDILRTSLRPYTKGRQALDTL